MNDMVKTRAMCVIEGAFFLYYGQSFVVTEVVGGFWEELKATDSRGNVHTFNGLASVEVDCKSSLVPSHSGASSEWLTQILVEG